MNAASTLGQNAAVSRLLNQRMLEDVLDLRQLVPQPDQLRVLELCQAVVQTALCIADRFEHSVKEAAPDDRCKLQCLLDLLFQAIRYAPGSGLEWCRED